MSRYHDNLAKYPGLDQLAPKDYTRGYDNGYKSGSCGKAAPPGMATVRGKITTAHGTGFRHGFIQGTRDRKDGKIK